MNNAAHPYDSPATATAAREEVRTMERVYDDERAMNLIASALLDLESDDAPDAVETFIDLIAEVVELTGRDPDAVPRGSND